jgi:hypothetical protein
MRFKELVTTNVTVEKSMAVEKGRFTLELPGGQLITGEYITEWKLTGKQWRIASDAATATNIESAHSEKW